MHINIFKPERGMGSIKSPVQNAYFQSFASFRGAIKYTDTDAENLIRKCANPHAGYTDKKTFFSKPTFNALVRCAKEWSKPVVLAIFNAIGKQKPNIITGSININVLAMKLIELLTNSNMRLAHIFKRTKFTNDILQIFDAFLCSILNTPITIEFLMWLEKQPLDSFGQFLLIADHQFAIASDTSKACDYIMKEFELFDLENKWKLFDIIYDTDEGRGYRVYETEEDIKSRLGDELFFSLYPKALAHPPSTFAEAVNQASFIQDNQFQEEELEMPEFAEDYKLPTFESFNASYFSSFTPQMNVPVPPVITITLGCLDIEEAQKIIEYQKLIQAERSGFNH